jgi:hypothetical protein
MELIFIQIPFKLERVVCSISFFKCLTTEKCFFRKISYPASGWEDDSTYISSLSIFKSLAKSHSSYSHLTIHLAKIPSLYFGTLQQTSQIVYVYTRHVEPLVSFRGLLAFLPLFLHQQAGRQDLAHGSGWRVGVARYIYRCQANEPPL